MCSYLLNSHKISHDEFFQVLYIAIEHNCVQSLAKFDDNLKALSAAIDTTACFDDLVKMRGVVRQLQSYLSGHLLNAEQKKAVRDLIKTFDYKFSSNCSADKISSASRWEGYLKNLKKNLVMN